MGASQHHNPVLGCLSVIYLLSAPGSAVGPLVASLPLPLRRALALWPCRRPRALREGLTRQCAWSSWARGVARLHVHARRDVLAQPPFSWPPNGRALVAATWHGHPRPCACGVAHALDKGSGRPLASGMGRSARHTAVLGLPAPPSGPHFRLTNTRRCRAISGPVWHVATPCCSKHTGATRRGAGGGLGLSLIHI